MQTYTQDVIHKTLELAAAIGVKPAAKQMDIPRGTVDSWTRQPQYSELWAELRRLNAPKWHARAAVPLEDLVDEYGETLAKALKRATRQLDEIPPRDLGNFIRSIAVAHGVASDHVGKLRGQPTQVVEHVHSAERLEKGMQLLLEQAAAIDSTAEEIPEETS